MRSGTPEGSLDKIVPAQAVAPPLSDQLSRAKRTGFHYLLEEHEDPYEAVVFSDNSSFLEHRQVMADFSPAQQRMVDASVRDSRAQVLSALELGFPPATLRASRRTQRGVFGGDGSERLKIAVSVGGTSTTASRYHSQRSVDQQAPGGSSLCM
ncbi:unnamed protein product [Amoebophrya sp. A25]|nr:unnamed protein product [Amoebophrya sp. A25]|eukprot:GSA25T00011023001.1